MGLATADEGTNSKVVIHGSHMGGQIPKHGTHYVPGELVVLDRSMGSKWDKVEVLQSDGQTLEALQNEARELESELHDIAVVEPNYVYKLAAEPNDDRYRDQYFLRQVGAPSAWNTTKGEGVRICVIDSGYDRGNPELATKVVAERDLVGESHDGRAEDDIGHGTHVAGIAAAATDNYVGTAGVGWKSELVIAKAFDAAGNGTVADLVQALDFCQRQGAAVVNMSFAGVRGSAALEAEVEESVGMGMTLVASAGNYGSDQTLYPAGYPGVIGVGAANRDGTLRPTSNTGLAVDLVAPGEDIISAYPYYLRPYEGVAAFSGTSESAPQVAGGAALLRAEGLDREHAQGRLFKHAEDRGPVGRDDEWGHGFLDLRCAVRPGLEGCG
jgi:serine protease